MKYRIFSSSAPTHYLATKLAERGDEVELIVLPEERAHRPLRLTHGLCQELRALLLRHGQSIAAFDAALEIETPHYNFLADLRPDAWIDSRLLTEALRGAAQASVWTTLAAESSPTLLLDQEELFTIVDRDLEKLPYGWLWPQVARHPDSKSYVLESAELYLPEGREPEVESGDFIHLEGSVGFLESHPTGGYVLSFYSQSRYALERALRAVQGAKAAGPSFWRALVLLNRGLQTQLRSLKVGLSGLQVPGIFQLSSLVGNHSPLGNIHAVEAFYQAQRFLEHLPLHASLLRPERNLSCEDWLKKEKLRFERSASRLKIWERLLFTERPSWVFNSLCRVLPPALKKALKTPLTLT